MASTDTVSDVMFVISGIVIVVGLVIHYAWPDKTEQELKPSKPRSTLSGVIQLLMIVVGLMVAIAVIDFIAMSIGTSGPDQHQRTPTEWRL
jgi:hypothetical protein